MDDNSNFSNTSNSNKMPTPEEFAEYVAKLKAGYKQNLDSTIQNESYKPKVDLFSMVTNALIALYPALDPNGTPAKLIATSHKVLSIPGVLPIIKSDIVPLAKEVYTSASKKLGNGGISSFFKGKTQPEDSNN